MITRRLGNGLIVEFEDKEITKDEALRRILAMLSAPRRQVTGNTSPADGRAGRRAVAHPGHSAAAPGAIDEAARSARIAVEMVAKTLEELRALSMSVNDLGRVATTLLERLTDVSHLTVSEAARFLDVSEKTVRTRIKEGSLALEVVPGTRRHGIPIRQLSTGWVGVKIARELGGRERS